MPCIFFNTIADFLAIYCIHTDYIQNINMVFIKAFQCYLLYHLRPYTRITIAIFGRFLKILALQFGYALQETLICKTQTFLELKSGIKFLGCTERTILFLFKKYFDFTKRFYYPNISKQKFS